MQEFTLGAMARVEDLAMETRLDRMCQKRSDSLKTKRSLTFHVETNILGASTSKVKYMSGESV